MIDAPSIINHICKFVNWFWYLSTFRDDNWIFFWKSHERYFKISWVNSKIYRSNMRKRSVRLRMQQNQEKGFKTLTPGFFSVQIDISSIEINLFVGLALIPLQLSISFRERTLRLCLALSLRRNAFFCATCTSSVTWSLGFYCLIQRSARFSRFVRNQCLLRVSHQT